MSARATDGGLEHAVIRIENGEREGERIPVLFNPTEYSLDRTVQYGEQEIAGLTSPITQFVSGNAETLSMELFFDTSEERADVTEHTDSLDRLLTIDGTLGAPPYCRFVWGESLSFKSVLESADKRFTMFRPDGTPLRARVNVTFREVDPPSEGGSGDGGSEGTRTRVVGEGDTLWGIAGEEYGDPTQWRRIASANGVADPRTLQPGTELTIPRGSG